MGFDALTSKKVLIPLARDAPKRLGIIRDMSERESPERIYRCPTCDQPLVPVWTLPKDKIEIRQQLYCEPCDRRYAIEEVLAAKTAKPKVPRRRPKGDAS